MPHYLPAADYARLVPALLSIEPDAVAGEVDACCIRRTLGEHDLWPDDLLDDEDAIEAIERVTDAAETLVAIPARPSSRGGYSHLW